MNRSLAGTMRVATGKRVAVVGSLNVDLFYFADSEPVDDGAVEVRQTATAPGGHAGNCASAMATLGLAVSLVAAVGSDADGRMLMADLADRGVDYSSIREIDSAATGRAIIPVFGERHYMLLCRGANDVLSAEDAACSLRSGFEAVVLFDPAASALLTAATVAARLVPRPLVCWTPGGIYAKEPIAADILPYCDVVFVNRAERSLLEKTLGRSLDEFNGLEAVTTLGAQGSLVRCGGAEWFAPAEPADVVDPTGAGDAFTAAYVLARLVGLDPPVRLALGNRAGALAIGAAGARGHLATLSELAAD